MLQERVVVAVSLGILIITMGTTGGRGTARAGAGAPPVGERRQGQEVACRQIAPLQLPVEASASSGGTSPHTAHQSANYWNFVARFFGAALYHMEAQGTVDQEH